MRVILPNTISSVDGSFSRASIGTYHDAAGIIQTAPINEIRFDTDPDPVNLLFKGLLYEESRQNVCTHSEDFSNAAWTKTECTATISTGTSPDGTTSTSYRLTENTTAGALRNIQDTIAWISGDTYTISAYVKEDGTSAKRYAGLFVPSGVMTTAVWIVWDLTTGLVTGSNGTFVGNKLQKLPNGWNRIELTVTAQVTTSAAFRIFFTTSPTNGVATWTGDNSSGIFVWGAQAEKHSLLSAIRASSYIKTTGTTVTRSADVVTGDGLVFTTVTDPNALWSAGTTYAIGDRVRYNNKIWESIASGHTGVVPGTDVTKWIEVGPDNMHAAIDNMISTESTATTEMTFVVRTGSIDSVSLLNVVADTVKVCLTDPVAGNVYYNTYGLAGVSVFDWQQYFFYDPLLKRTQIVLSNLPQYANGLVTIRLQTTVGETVKVAQALFGIASEIGLTQYGARAGIIDYSRKEVDQFGNVTFVERNFSKRLSADVFVSNVELNRVQTLLYAIRAKPSVWVATDNQQFEEALIIYGFYRDFSTTISYPSHSICSLEIEGLT